MYNKERFLDRCIQSVLDSPLKEFEIICIEDGSTDGSKAWEIYYETMEKSQAQGCFIRFQISSDHASNEMGIIHEYKDVYRGLDLLDRFVNNNENFLYACNAIWQREFLLENKIQFKNTKIGEGGLLILEGLLKAERVVCSNFAGYHYMINPTSTNKTRFRNQRSVS